MIELAVLLLGFLGLLSMFKDRSINAPMYGEDLVYDRPSYRIAGNLDDGQMRQSRRREKEQDRRTEETHCSW
jgi:hypothetical protein